MVASCLTMRGFAPSEITAHYPVFLPLRVANLSGSSSGTRSAKPRPVDLSEPRANRNGNAFASALPSSHFHPTPSWYRPETSPPNFKLLPQQLETFLLSPFLPLTSTSTPPRASSAPSVGACPDGSLVLAGTPLSTTLVRTRRTLSPGPSEPPALFNQPDDDQRATTPTQSSVTHRVSFCPVRSFYHCLARARLTFAPAVSPPPSSLVPALCH